MFGKPCAVVDVGGEVVPLFDLAEREVFGDRARGQVVEDLGHVAGLHAAQDHQRAAREAGR